MTVRSYGLWWGTIEGATLPELAEVAGAAGFGAISVTPAMYFAALDEGRSDAQLRELLAVENVTVAIIDPLIRGLPGAPDPASMARRFRATFEYGEDDAFRAAEALGATAVNIAHYMGAPTPLAELSASIRDIARRAADRGLRIFVEFMPEGGIGDLAAAAEVVARVDAPNVAIMLDTWHFFRTAGELAQLEQLPPGAIGAVQVGDAATETWGIGSRATSADRLLPGSGVVPIGDIVAIARRNNPAVIVGIEVFNRTSSDVPALTRATAAATAMHTSLAH
jgi:sugar phosphate isomerase/epimerase